MSTTRISSITAHEIIASGGFPTIEVDVQLEDGSQGRASVPYGASAGSHEAFMLTDGDDRRYLGKGVLEAVNNVRDELAKELKGHDALDQRGLDEKMIALDGSEQKATLGGNAILGVSLAVARAAAASKGQELHQHISETFEIDTDLTQLPQPMAVVIEGGKHAHNSTDLQEYCLSALGEKSRAESLRAVLESYHQLKKILEKAGLSTNVGNEGAFAPEGMESNEAPLQYLVQAIEAAGYRPGQDLSISIDAAASEFFVSTSQTPGEGKYALKLEKRELSSPELIDYFAGWVDRYPIITMEDMLHEDDWAHWPLLTERLSEEGVENIGDDLTVTNSQRLQRAIDEKAISAILIKLNQIGSLTETVDTCLLAKKHGLMTVTSHRGGGETNDTAMIDVAVAVNSRFVKVGPSRGERVAKYNRLLEIERKVRAAA